MHRPRIVVVALVVILGGSVVLAPAASASPGPALPNGDIAGFTATPGGAVTSVQLTVTVPTVVSSADCDTPGHFEYAEFGLFLGTNTFGRVDGTCGNTGNVAYFCDIESGGTLKIILVKPGQQVTLGMSVSGSTTTITMQRGATFKSVSGTAGSFTSVRIGGTDEPGFPIPVMTTPAKFTAVAVNGQGLASTSRVETALFNGVHVLMKPSVLTATSDFKVKFVQQS